MIEVLHVIDSLAPGGAEHNLVALLARLSRDRFRNHVAWLFEGDALVERLRPHVATLLPLRASGPLDLPRAAADLADWLRAHRPRVVHAQLLYAHLTARMAARATGVSMMTTWQNLIYEDATLSDFGGSPALRDLFLAFDRATADYERRFVAVSRHVADTWTRWLAVAPERVTVVHNAIEPERYRTVEPEELAATRAGLPLDPADEVLLSVGRLVAGKGHAEVLTALPAVLAKRPRARLMIAGDGPQRAELEEQARRLGLGDRVLLLGQRRDIPALARLASGFVFATHSEGLSLALVELLALGLPGVVSDIPPNREVAGSLPCARFFPVGDSRAIADAVVAMLKEPRPPSATERQAICARFSPDSLALQLGAELERTAAGAS
jgi:glycosyltransferase involved in cell wall biosynthesis